MQLPTRTADTNCRKKWVKLCTTNEWHFHAIDAFAIASTRPAAHRFLPVAVLIVEKRVVARLTNSSSSKWRRSLPIEQIDERPVKRQQEDFDDEQFLVDVEANDAEQMDQNRASIRQETVNRTEEESQFQSQS